ncbi:OsmC family protein [Formosa algae]|uniref:Redox protein n=1 Tax=Formosa algae TaxID=225843 RepID=A0A9X1CAB3_9FLAO|nr:OsmC family protein [Formosa algae]MBP1838757.1 putative redox protein [Formosa algae]MDQ0335257.1 putative redox protein [Formosa algae]OEI79839.1 osmotically inducible protein OsmC [Formosa algae]
MTHKVTTEWKKNVKFESDNPSGHNLFIDLGEDNGGKGEGYRPKALMLSALAGCSGVDITPMLEKMKVDIDDFKIVIEGHLTEEHPKYYHIVTVDYHFYGSDLNESKINRAVDLSVDKYCGVMEMFRRFADVQVKSHFHNS